MFLFFFLRLPLSDLSDAADWASAVVLCAGAGHGPTPYALLLVAQAFWQLLNTGTVPGHHPLPRS